MAIRNIVQQGDELLRKKSKEVTEFDKRLAVLLDDMKETVKKERGAGLAAVQVGVLKRAVVVDVDEGFFEFINPVIVSSEGSVNGVEGCLSVRGRQGNVRRPAKVELEYKDRKGQFHKLTAEGFFARAICHELDHLDGVLYIDKATEIWAD